MGLVLILGGIFDFVLLIALNKYRLMQDVRVKWMESIEKEMGIENIPVSTEKAIRFLNEINHTHRTFSWFRARNAFRSLFFAILVLFITSLSIGIGLIYFYLVMH